MIKMKSGGETRRFFCVEKSLRLQFSTSLKDSNGLAGYNRSSFGERMRNLLAFTIVVFAAPAAYAYLDPGAGSIVLQIILGGLAGVGVAWKLFWHRLRGRSKPGVPPEDVE